MEKKVVKLKCPTCGRQLKLGKNSLAKKIVCPNCNARFRVEQNNSTIVADENDLFGPPVDDSFADIESIIDDQNATRSKQDRTSLGDSHTTRQSAHVNEAWQQRKKVTTKLDESLHRNGVGLLILSVGLSAIPVFASSVEGLEIVALYLPIAAVCLAFFATFLLAYSHRRGSVGSIILCMFPFILVSVISLIAYTFFVQPLSTKSPEFSTQTNSEKQIDPPDDTDPEGGLLDKAAVENNPTESFVPPRLKQPESNLRPVAPKLTKKNVEGSQSPVKDSQLRPSQTVKSSITDDNPTSQQLRNELARAKKSSEDRDKLAILNKRIDAHLKKALVSKGIVHGIERQLSLTEVVGNETVYGSAIYTPSPINGIDFGRRIQANGNSIDLLVPIVDRAEFADSFVVPKGNFLLGARFKFASEKLVAVQPVYGKSTDSTVNGNWLGNDQNSRKTNVESIVSNRQIHGFVLYRDQLNVVGAALVVGDLISTPIN